MVVEMIVTWLQVMSEYWWKIKKDGNGKIIFVKNFYILNNIKGWSWPTTITMPSNGCATYPEHYCQPFVKLSFI